MQLTYLIIMAKWRRAAPWILMNIVSVNVLVPAGTKSLSFTMFTYCYLGIFGQLQWHLDRNINLLIDKNALEYVLREIPFTSSRSQCVNFSKCQHCYITDGNDANYCPVTLSHHKLHKFQISRMYATILVIPIIVIQQELDSNAVLTGTEKKPPRNTSLFQIYETILHRTLECFKRQCITFVCLFPTEFVFCIILMYLTRVHSNNHFTNIDQLK